MKPTVLILVGALVAGCNADQTYRSLQTMEQSRCAEGPASEYQDCLQNAGMSYEEYEARRKEEALDHQMGEAPATSANLRDTYWKLVEIGGRPIVTKENAGEAHLILDSTDARAHGSGGCNRFFAQYRNTGEALSFSAVGSTMMACPENMDTEQAFFSALGQTGRAQITGRILELYGPEGLLARLEAVNPD